MPRTKCDQCDTFFSKNEVCLECNACKKKYHEKCSKLSEAEFKIMTQRTQLKWFCEMCNEDVTDMLNNFEKFRKVSKEIEKMKNDINSKMNDFEKRLISVECSSSPTSVTNQIEQQVKKTTELDKEEVELIKSKEQNLVYFNVPESDSETPGEKMKHDFKLLNEAHKNEMQHNHISNIFRVGKKTDKIRPLIVKYSSLQMKNDYLKKGGSLKIQYRNEIRNVYMSIDRTMKQREVHKKLVKELKERRENGEENIAIRNEKIVTNFQKQNVAQKVTWASIVATA